MNLAHGDILSVQSGLIVHGVNMQGKMGSGVAKAIRERYPQVYKDYMHAYESGNLHLGTVVYTKINSDLIIASAVTQRFYGRVANKRYVSYSAIDMAFEDIHNTAYVKNLHVHFPQIGAGRGGGDWSIIESHIVPRLRHLLSTLWIL